MICFGRSVSAFRTLPQMGLLRKRHSLITNATPSKISAFSGSRPKSLKVQTRNPSLLLKCSLKDYGNLKAELVKNLILSGGFFTFYFSATLSVEAGAASFVGACGSYVYMKMLISDIDNLSSLDQIPITQIQKMEDGNLKKFLSLLAHYRQAFSRRLLPLIALGVLIKFSGFFIEGGMPRVDQGCMLIGFLSYKISLFLALYDALKPNLEEEIGVTPPTMRQTEDFDIYGRRKSDVVKKLTDRKD